jgi:hypothetical protein
LSKKNRFQKGGFVDTKQAEVRAKIDYGTVDTKADIQPSEPWPKTKVGDGSADTGDTVGQAETDFGIGEPVLFPYKKQPVKKCLSCRYARRLEAEQHKARCHRHPPVLVVERNAMAGTSTPLVDGWPIVLVDDFCGEHTA